MKIYKVNYESHQKSSQGFSFHSSKVGAEKALAKFKRLSGEDFNPDSGIQISEVTPTKKGIISALNYHAEHNDNG